MIQKFIFAAALVLIATLFAGQVYPAQGDELDAKAVMQLNQQAMKVLNIDLNSLRWLLDASSDSYFLQASLVENNQLGPIEALQKNGYAKLEVGVDDVPGGGRGAYLRIIPTEKGRRVIDLLTKAGR